jgi:hypothetical protein
MVSGTHDGEGEKERESWILLVCDGRGKPPIGNTVGQVLYWYCNLVSPGPRPGYSTGRIPIIYCCLAFIFLVFRQIEEAKYRK